MSNVFEKSIDLGLGFLLYSREKIEDLVEELVGKGEVAKKDARQFAADLVQRGAEQREELKKLVRSEIEKALDSVNVAKKDDLMTKDEIRDLVREQIQQALKDQGISQNEDTK